MAKVDDKKLPIGVKIEPSHVTGNLSSIASNFAGNFTKEQRQQGSAPFSVSWSISQLNNVVDDTKNIISHGKLKLDPAQLECEWNGKPLPDKLTTTEFLIVKELAKRPGVIKERAHLMDIAYKENTEIEVRTIDSHVKRIRKKFKRVDEKFSAIETRYGSGYRWNVS